MRRIGDLAGKVLGCINDPGAFATLEAAGIRWGANAAKPGGKVRLAIHDGDLLTGSLTQPGFAAAVHPDWSAMSPLAQPAPRISLEKAV